MRLRREIGKVAIALRHNNRRKGPRNIKSRVIPAKAAFQIGRMIFVHQIDNVRIVRKRDKPVGETFWRTHYFAVIGAEFGASVFAESRRVGAQIHNDIPNRTAHNADNFIFLWAAVDNAYRAMCLFCLMR